MKPEDTHEYHEYMRNKLRSWTRDDLVAAVIWRSIKLRQLDELLGEWIAEARKEERPKEKARQ